jgi:hypothetical protein
VNGGLSCSGGQKNSWYGKPIPMGLGFGGKFEIGFGMRMEGVRALKHVKKIKQLKNTYNISCLLNSKG